jgi:uncharacterized protein (TIGR03085 family)
MTSDLDLRERRELADLFDELGPDRPTLCGDWETSDLATHLVVRERDLTAMPGILFEKALGGVLGRRTEGAMASLERRHTYPEIVELVRTGPPFGPSAIRPIGHAMNLIEFFVHHEDVRRANGATRRTDRVDLDIELWSLLRRLAPLMVRTSGLRGVTLVLDPGEGRPHRIGSGPTVTISGPPSELVLELYGRRSVAEVTYDGAEADIAAVQAADFGI